MKDLLELIKRIHTEEPNSQTASKYAGYFGVACVFLVLWNTAFLSLFRSNWLIEKMDSTGARVALVLVALAGLFALAANWKLKSRSFWGSMLAKGALLLSVGGLVVFLVSIWIALGAKVMMLPIAFRIVFGVFLILMSSQFLLPAWFAFGYLNRLDDVLSTVLPLHDYRGEFVPKDQAGRPRFREGLSPFGSSMTFIVCLGGIVLPLLLATKFLGVEPTPFIFFPVVLLILLGPMAWNELPSSFERSRIVLSRHRVGISMPFFNASSPLGKILVYRDGVEVRVMLNRYFLPYDQLTEPPRLEGMVFKSIALRSRLPNVPNTIRIGSHKSAMILEDIERATG